MKKKKKLKKMPTIMVCVITVLVIASISILISMTNKNTESEQTISSEEISEMTDENKTDDTQTASADETEPEETEENTPSNEETTEPKKGNNNNASTNTGSNYYIKVNYQANVVTIYKKENGEKTPIKAMVCSCGTSTPTSGTYKTTNKYTWRALVGGVYGQYATRIVGSILFHSVPYTKQSKDSLEYWEYDKLGQTASLGCVRLTVADAKWIYTNCPQGTEVEFYASVEPGPLGKPSAQKISSNEECRNWDPTDNVKENPWMSWSSKKEEQENKKEDKVENKVENKIVENKVIENNVVNNNVIKNETNKNNIESTNKVEEKNEIKNIVNNIKNTL